MRINKYLAACGISSRRGADRLIDAGEVFINGQKATPGDRVNDGDEVVCMGRKVYPVENKVVLAYNKPSGIVCSSVSQAGDEINIVDALDYPVRVFPVGRLDKDSRGLILLTNDGDLAQEIMRSCAGHEKEYRVSLDKPFEDGFLERMSEGVEIELEERVYRTKSCRTYRISEECFGIVLTEGKNRQIRKMCAALGYEVTDLLRIRVGGVKLKDIPEGSYVEVDSADVRSV